MGMGALQLSQPRVEAFFDRECTGVFDINKYVAGYANNRPSA